LKARHTYSITETKFDVSLMVLTKLSMRFRTDYIVVGEVTCCNKIYKKNG